MSKQVKTGTFIHGIAASEHLDSSGERILIKGVDISSLTNDGILNWEHKNENASQIVGKILEAKKIFKKEDCDNAAQKYFWDKIKTPYVYIMGELFDHVGHSAAQDVAAMLKYDKNLNKDKTKALINFSIEGSRLGKEGSVITKCIARKVTVTITPCNKMAFAEELEKKDSKSSMGGINIAKDILDKFKKSEQIEIELMEKSAKKYYSGLYEKGPNSKMGQTSPTRDYVKITPTTGEQREGSSLPKPKRTFTSATAPDKMKVGDRIDHTGGKPKAKTGHSIYNDPDTWKSEAKKKKKKVSFESNMRKAITAGCGGGAPSSLSGGAALQSESLDRKIVEKSRVENIKMKRDKKVAQDHKSRKARLESDAKAARYNESNRKTGTYNAKKLKPEEVDSGHNSPASAIGIGSKYIRNINKSIKKKVYKNLTEDAWSRFTHKEEIIEIISKKDPNLSKSEVLAIAKGYSYYSEKKQELVLHSIMKREECIKDIL